MRRIVFIGCGGSGNVVIGYLMDRLRAALREAALQDPDLREQGYDRLPATWQFLVVDARHAPEDLPDGLGTVRDHGAHYQAVSPSVGSYQVVDAAVSQSAMDDMATWAPRDPSKITVPIQDGAGQMRSVGRVLLASQAQAVAAALKAAADRTKSDRATTDARLLEGVCGPLEGGERPMAIVISSMAGGSGASMALDVCRLLTDSYNVRNSAMFAFTPDIFDSMPANTRSGVRPNSLAMLGEIVAMQMGEGKQHDLHFMSNLGLATGGGEDIPVRRVIPIGRFASDGTPFGDGSTTSIYRALSSGLAALVMSSRALGTYVKQVIENETPTPSLAPGLFGWGGPASALQWGSMGYGSLSMGRDRYAEYAAQRISRAAADHLLEGHLQRPTEEVPGDVQLQQRLSSELPHVRQRMGLPDVQVSADANTVMNGLVDWLRRTGFRTEEAAPQVRALINAAVVEHLPQSGGDATDLATRVRTVVRGVGGSVSQRVEEIAYRAAYEWHLNLVAAIERETDEALARHGAVYARAMVDDVGQQLVGVWGAKGLRDLALRQPSAAAAPPKVDDILGKLTGTINDVAATILEPLRAAYGNHVLQAIYGRFADLAAKASEDIAKGVLDPLRATLSSLLVGWENEVAMRPGSTAGGLSVTQTNLYPLWPSDEDQIVAKRWFTAQNEVLLTDPGIFSDRFRADLAAAVADDATTPSQHEAVQTTIGWVISGDWPTTAGQGAPGTALAIERNFVAETFKVVPGNSNQILTARPAGYKLDLAPAQLLARSREYVARPGASFSTFVKGTIQEYAATREGAAAIERGFGELLSKAQPLAQVDGHTYSSLHGHAIPAAVTYTFTAIPFEGTELATDLEQVIQARHTGPTTISNYDNALTSENLGLSQISAFGYFPTVTPAVFDNIWKPVRDQWASAKVAESPRLEFWSHRRARPLTGALAMSAAERLAMVGGWLVGQMTGAVQIPDPPYEQPVRVWDGAANTWIPFPYPLLYPPSQFVRNYEWLPAVLESHLLALAGFGVGDIRGSSMRPYQVLRGLWDTDSQAPTNLTSGMFTLGAHGLVTRWVQTGEVPSGGQSRQQAPTEEERRENAKGFLEKVSKAAVAEQAPIRTAGERRTAAVFGDLAEDVLAVTSQIMQLLDARSTASQLPDDAF